MEKIYSRTGLGKIIGIGQIFGNQVVWWWNTQSFFHGKRIFDLLLIGLALLVLMPIFLIVFLAIKLDDGGPVFYWQKRVGKDGQEFDFPKFRSMSVGADAVLKDIEHLNKHGESITFKMKKDPRVTRVGKFLRRTSMDELPQLWCVLNGDMTLVGPRPPTASEVKKYTLADRRRLSVTPGLTCIWQVSGRSDIPFAQQAIMDVHYIRNQSLALDLRLLASTVPAVILGRGAY